MVLILHRVCGWSFYYSIVSLTKMRTPQNRIDKQLKGKGETERETVRKENKAHSRALRGGDTPGSLLSREYRSSGRWSRSLPDRP